MKGKRAVGVFRAYLGARLRVFAAFLLFFGIFAVVYSLYRLHWEPFVYSLELSLAAALALAFFDFLRYRRKHRALLALKNSVSVSRDSLPEAADLIEADYQSLVGELWGLYRETADRATERETETTEYYTLWAHQIKTPISAIRLLLQTGETEGLTGDLERELFKIEQYVEMVLQYLRLGEPLGRPAFKGVSAL